MTFTTGFDRPLPADGAAVHCRFSGHGGSRGDPRGALSGGGRFGGVSFAVEQRGFCEREHRAWLREGLVLMLQCWAPA